MSDSKSLNHDPLSDADAILSQDFYGQETAPEPARPRRRRRTTKAKPTHYKVICISMYTKDIESLEEKVAELKRRGHTKANKSQLIRMALSQIDLDKVPLPQP
ncbi:hypothetical protein [Haliangium ochraceum]|uniref:Uncharacterized protein n=1 Tax=Haliangium ochraceum (strain DSM 14365 / JCM 11303 / SMP-2) TaxID=502025 RepID=D0LRD3_HALO1|nr:hypothetical protein [Haliangium ochraceum]ACY17161.1 conserved hypothetical protein [Haliangium ochraceum DSM 14365]